MLPPLHRCANAAAAAAPAPLPQQKFTHISRSKIMIFGREICVCEMCCFVMMNEKRQKTRNTYYFYYVRKSLLPLKMIKFSRSMFCHCSARAKLFKKKTPSHPACRTNFMQDNIPVRPDGLSLILFCEIFQSFNSQEFPHNFLFAVMQGLGVLVCPWSYF